mmetsp:Transcript_15941/g.49597  ORF Transcript_15941/g.49597 Transcript_15941/m.49597 type:complete len:332 (-) Transcript_15941:60-1055(-)
MRGDGVHSARRPFTAPRPRVPVPAAHLEGGQPPRGGGGRGGPGPRGPRGGGHRAVPAGRPLRPGPGPRLQQVPGPRHAERRLRLPARGPGRAGLGRRGAARDRRGGRHLRLPPPRQVRDPDRRGVLQVPGPLLGQRWLPLPEASVHEAVLQGARGLPGAALGERLDPRADEPPGGCRAVKPQPPRRRGRRGLLLRALQGHAHRHCEDGSAEHRGEHVHLHERQRQGRQGAGRRGHADDPGAPGLWEPAVPARGRQAACKSWVPSRYLRRAMRLAHRHVAAARHRAHEGGLQVQLRRVSCRPLLRARPHRAGLRLPMRMAVSPRPAADSVAF